MHRHLPSYGLAVMALLLGLVVGVGIQSVHGDARTEHSRPIPMPERIELPADVWDDVPVSEPNPVSDVLPRFDFVLSE